MTTTNTASKKPRTTSSEDDFEVLRQYILNCPHFPNSSENPAVKAALSGIEQEQKKRERDRKLQQKFSKGASLSKTTPSSAAANEKGKNSASDNSISNTVTDHTAGKLSTSSASGDEDFMNEWQDVGEDRKKASSSHRENNPDEDGVEIIDMEGETSFLGERLAEISIASIAEYRAEARTPVAAIALALHAAMCSDLLGFVCTGVPDEGGKKSNGFAAPVRELPRGQFLPKDWDKNASDNSDPQQYVLLRYRKDGTGSVHLKVEKLTDQQEVSVKLVPANTQEPPSDPLVFPLDQHVNLDSWSAAVRVATSSLGLEPALHYKGLPALLSSFAKTFDLGSIRDSKQGSHEVPFFHPSGGVPPNLSTGGIGRGGDNKMMPRFVPPVCAGGSSRENYGDRGPTFEDSFPQQWPMVGGDFSGDLAPGGGVPLDPLRRPGPDMSGNLMGPNHPAFRGGGTVGGGMVGPPGGRFGMQPRFDPFGPPGGPQEIDPDDPNTPNGKRVPPHLRPARGGDPNPDHLNPPNSLGNNNFGGNMFM